MSELRRIRQLKDGNRCRKGIVADLSMDKHMPNEALRNKPGPTERRALATWFVTTFGVPVARACALA